MEAGGRLLLQEGFPSLMMMAMMMMMKGIPSWLQGLLPDGESAYALRPPLSQASVPIQWPQNRNDCGLERGA